MTGLDTNLIIHHADLARGYLAGDPDVAIERGEAALKAVVNEHVDALLVELERLTDQDVLDVLGSIDNALHNGSYMTNANLAMNLLCERLGIDRDRLLFAPGRIGEIAAEPARPAKSCPRIAHESGVVLACTVDHGDPRSGLHANVHHRALWEEGDDRIVSGGAA